jgi:hypothetical protein
LVCENSTGQSSQPKYTAVVCLPCPVCGGHDHTWTGVLELSRLDKLLCQVNGQRAAAVPCNPLLGLFGLPLHHDRILILLADLQRAGMCGRRSIHPQSQCLPVMFTYICLSVTSTVQIMQTSRPLIEAPSLCVLHEYWNMLCRHLPPNRCQLQVHPPQR